MSVFLWIQLRILILYIGEYFQLFQIFHHMLLKRSLHLILSGVSSSYGSFLLISISFLLLSPSIFCFVDCHSGSNLNIFRGCPSLDRIPPHTCTHTHSHRILRPCQSMFIPTYRVTMSVFRGKRTLVFYCILRKLFFHVWKRGNCQISHISAYNGVGRTSLGIEEGRNSMP